MLTTQKKVMQSTKQVAQRPTLGNRSTLCSTSRRTLSRSQSMTALSSFPSDTKDANLKEKLVLYRKEFSLYHLRVLQRKLIERENEKREDEVKNCLVSLKTEYENLLEENVKLYEEVQTLETYGNCMEDLEKVLPKAREFVKIIKDSDFVEKLKKIKEVLEINTNRLNLVDLKKSDLDDAFETNILGVSSDLFILLKKMEEYVVDHKTHISDIATEIKEIERLNTENEKLRKRCVDIINKAHSESLEKNHDYYFDMAVKECRDIMPVEKNKKFSTQASFNYTTGDLGSPSGASTPVD